MNNNIETFKLQHVALEFKVNEVKQTVTAIEKFIVPKFNFKYFHLIYFNVEVQSFLKLSSCPSFSI